MKRLLFILTLATLLPALVCTVRGWVFATSMLDIQLSLPLLVLGSIFYWGYLYMHNKPAREKRRQQIAALKLLLGEK